MCLRYAGVASIRSCWMSIGNNTPIKSFIKKTDKEGHVISNHVEDIIHVHMYRIQEHSIDW